MVNVADNCDDPQNPEYRQVFVRGRCVYFSPSIINKYLGRSDEEVAELKVTDNDICRIITGNRLKQWPSQKKLSALQLSPLYAVLNKIAAVNWVPTTHSSNIAKELARFIYVVGTKAMFDYGSYVFDATLEHAVSFAL
ncbi:putative envelope-like protein [Trifolium pratense]|uniref:Putative envelope-like protein n=1 Tax=Trifolium pratense TaxID=57577 RepID=A0A2K3JY52_TRIPR|nr:putative envelope-like protein [Trifolium pratense]